MKLWTIDSILQAVRLAIDSQLDRSWETIPVDVDPRDCISASLATRSSSRIATDLFNLFLTSHHTPMVTQPTRSATFAPRLQ